MQGRYGVLDTLGKVLLVLGLVLAFFAPVFSGILRSHHNAFSHFWKTSGNMHKWERKIPEQDSEDTRIFQKSEKSDGAEKGLSYLYLSGMQAENPDSERQRKDRDPLSEVRDNIYQEELRLHKGIEASCDTPNTWYGSVIVLCLLPFMFYPFM